MKFSEIQQNDWEELKLYLDTCLLPLTGISGEEPPWKVTESLEKLRDLMDFVETPYKGRIVTYPALQYKIAEDQMVAVVDTLCHKLKADQFKYVIIITADDSIAKLEFQANDLLISPFMLMEDVGATRAKIDFEIQRLWK
jgi:23S rRNA (pseudouridine1915-N3)-methyltransferase